MKYFVVSDCHSFASELIEGLKKAGFSKTNKEHVLIVLGDIFDRGFETVEVYNFLKSIPKARRILVKGNHESLFMQLLKKSYPEDHDFSNCTVETFCHIASEVFAKDTATIDYLNWCYSAYFESNYSRGGYYYGDEAPTHQVLKNQWALVIDAVKKHPITRWLRSKEWKNYYELDKYIFVHSFIPTKLRQDVIDMYGIMAYGFENPQCYEYRPDWRECTDFQWEAATWPCPWASYQAGLFDKEAESGKVLVCGHWHTTAFFKHLNHITVSIEEHPIYYSKHLIGIDGGVRYADDDNALFVHPQNVLVIDDTDFDTCYDQDGFKLVDPAEKYKKIED